MDNYNNEGYEIIVALPIDATHALTIGRNPNAAAQYVCWDCTLNMDRTYSFSSGLYCSTYRQALHCITTRITSRYDQIPYVFAPFYEGHFTSAPLPLREEV